MEEQEREPQPPELSQAAAIETQQLEPAEVQEVESRESEAREDATREAEALPQSQPPAFILRSSGGQSSSRQSSSTQTSRTPREDSTQLVAIRELMQRSLANGAWLTLSEIAQATEFGEASISAQLRHLRKADRGRYRVEKRRRRAARVAAKYKRLRDAARRVPIIWEYRVLPPA